MLGCLNLVGRLILRPLLERLAENRSESKSSALAQGSELSLDACRVSISGKSVTAAQSALMERLMAEQDRLVQLVRTRIYEYYSEVYSIYADDDAPWTAIEVPQVRDGNEIDNNLRLTEIILHRDLPSIGLLFECTWEQEHGLGVRIDDFEFVEIGNAEVAALQ